MNIYTGPRAYRINDKSVPASVRLYNPGAIGKTKDGHEHRFGALASANLPASDGSQLPTPAFDTVYGGCAYFGHYIIRRAEVKPGQISISSIMKAYSTGHSDVYGNTVARDTGIGLYEPVDLWHDPDGYHKAYKIMLSMGRWEAGARSSSAPGYEAFNRVYNQQDQAVIDEMYWGLVHGMREAWRDKGYTIERTPEEWGYVAPEEPQDVPVEEDEERIDPTKDPLLDFFSGYKTLVTGTLAFISAFFTNIFDTLGLAEAEKYGTLAMQAFLILAAVFLAVKFWKRLEAMLARRVPKK